VQVELPNSAANPLKAGTFVYADFIQPGEGESLQIPRSALVESMKNPYVYIVVNGKAAMRKITVGRELGSNIEVVDGLKAGDQVIVNGQINLAEGTVVRIVK
jgi:multidrug efflux pump subunit AcrA (membrane-fusion protein)